MFVLLSLIRYKNRFLRLTFILTINLLFITFDATLLSSSSLLVTCVVLYVKCWFQSGNDYLLVKNTQNVAQG